MKHTINFTPFPVIATHRFLLRQLSEQDAAAIYILRTDEEVNRYIDRQRATSVEDVRAFIHKINENILKNESILWAICTKEDPALIGTICLWNIQPSQSTAEIGYELLPQHHGKGIMQEVIPHVINYGFQEMQLEIIMAELSPDNVKSVKLLEKNGFIFQEDKLPAEENGMMISYKLTKQSMHHTLSP
ncbi:MAG: GNAT family N-acetyltransferase [Chitinophagaceae bacterium]